MYPHLQSLDILFEELLFLRWRHFNAGIAEYLVEHIVDVTLDRVIIIPPHGPEHGAQLQILRVAGVKIVQIAVEFRN